MPDRPARRFHPFCAAWLGLLAGACAAAGPTGIAPTPSGLTSDPPDEKAWTAGARAVVAAVKMPGAPAVSPVRVAHPVSPGDWIMCLRTDDPAAPHPYAVFFNGATMVNFRIAVAVDSCPAQSYTPLPKP